MFAILIAVIIIIYCYYYYYKYNSQWKYIEQFPGPTTLPIIGNAHQLGMNPVDYLKSFMGWWRKYNSQTFRVWVGQEAFIVLSDPKDVEALLSSNTILDKATVYKFLYPWLGQGLLTSSGSKWFKHRKMITPSFHFKILVEFHEVMKRNSKKFVEKLTQRAKSKEIFDVQDMIHYCTLDVICETAMGTEINAMDNHDSDVVKAFQDMCYIIQNRVFNPFMANDFLFKFYKESQLLKKTLGILETFTMDIIQKRRIALNNQEKSDVNDFEDMSVKPKKAFLDTLLTATVDGRPLTLEEVYEEVSTFMFEGHDTTTSGVTFTIYLLSRHPEVQEKVFEEQKAIFGENMKNADPSYQDVQEMKYLDLVIKESQRLFPSVPLIGRKTSENTVLNGKVFPKDVVLMIFIYAMGYNEKYFKDPLKFDPERFNNREKENAFEYVPFSAGPRNCIGQKFAVLELKSIVSSVVRNFKILPPNEACLKNGNYEKLGSNTYDPILASVLTLKAENGANIRLQARN